MTFLDEIDRQRIEAAVAEAEKRTAAELVTVVARDCGDYLHLPTLVAAVTTLLLSGVALLSLLGGRCGIGWCRARSSITGPAPAPTRYFLILAWPPPEAAPA